MKILKEFTPYVVIIVVVVLIRCFVVTPVIVSGSSMDNTLTNNQVLILKKFDKNYQRFDIVVIDFNNEFLKEKLIKRIIGLPGEEVKYKDGSLYINNELVKDDFASITGDFTSREIGSVKIPEGKYLVLGDNRTNSVDSRLLGFIDEKDIKGTTNLRLFPFNKLGKIE